MNHYNQQNNNSQQSSVSPMGGNFEGLHPMYPVLCIPRVFKNITQQRIADNLNFLNLGEIQKIEMIPKVSKTGQEYQTVVIELVWNFTETACHARHKLLSTCDFKIIYDKNWFWKVFMFMPHNQAPAPNPQHVKRTSIAPLLDVGHAHAYTSSTNYHHQPNQPNQHQHRQHQHRQQRVIPHEVLPHRADNVEYDHSVRRQYDNRSGGSGKDESVNKQCHSKHPSEKGTPTKQFSGPSIKCSAMSEQIKKQQKNNDFQMKCLKEKLKNLDDKRIRLLDEEFQETQKETKKTLDEMYESVKDRQMYDSNGIPLTSPYEKVSQILKGLYGSDMEDSADSIPCKTQHEDTSVEDYEDELTTESEQQADRVVVDYTNTPPPAPRKKKTCRDKYFKVEPITECNV